MPKSPLSSIKRWAMPGGSLTARTEHGSYLIKPTDKTEKEFNLHFRPKGGGAPVKIGSGGHGSLMRQAEEHHLQTGPRGGQFYIAPSGEKVYTADGGIKGHNPHLNVSDPTLTRTTQVPPSENVEPLRDPVDYERRFCGRVLELERASSGGLVDDPDPVVDSLPFKNLRGEGREGEAAVARIRPTGVEPSRTWRPK